MLMESSNATTNNSVEPTLAATTATTATTTQSLITPSKELNNKSINDKVKELNDSSIFLKKMLTQSSFKDNEEISSVEPPPFVKDIAEPSTKVIEEPVGEAIVEPFVKGIKEAPPVTEAQNGPFLNKPEPTEQCFTEQSSTQEPPTQTIPSSISPPKSEDDETRYRLSPQASSVFSAVEDCVSKDLPKEQQQQPTPQTFTKTKSKHSLSIKISPETLKDIFYFNLSSSSSSSNTSSNTTNTTTANTMNTNRMKKKKRMNDDEDYDIMDPFIDDDEEEFPEDVDDRVTLKDLLALASSSTTISNTNTNTIIEDPLVKKKGEKMTENISDRFYVWQGVIPSTTKGPSARLTEKSKAKKKDKKLSLTLKKLGNNGISSSSSNSSTTKFSSSSNNNSQTKSKKTKKRKIVVLDEGEGENDAKNDVDLDQKLINEKKEKEEKEAKDLKERKEKEAKGALIKAEEQERQKVLDILSLVPADILAKTDPATKKKQDFESPYRNVLLAKAILEFKCEAKKYIDNITDTTTDKKDLKFPATLRLPITKVISMALQCQVSKVEALPFSLFELLHSDLPVFSSKSLERLSYNKLIPLYFGDDLGKAEIPALYEQLNSGGDVDVVGDDVGDATINSNNASNKTETATETAKSTVAKTTTAENDKKVIYSLIMKELESQALQRLYLSNATNVPVGKDGRKPVLPKWNELLIRKNLYSKIGAICKLNTATISKDFGRLSRRAEARLLKEFNLTPLLPVLTTEAVVMAVVDSSSKEPAAIADKTKAGKSMPLICTPPLLCSAKAAESDDEDDEDDDVRFDSAISGVLNMSGGSGANAECKDMKE